MGGIGGMGGMGGAGGGGTNFGCLTAADCPMAMVCDPVTTQCVANQCNPSLMQPGGCAGTDPVCLEQTLNSGFGACYELCDPFDTPCPNALECDPNGFGQDLGVCMQPGTATKGQPCTPDPTAGAWTITSGCAAGHTCRQDANNNNQLTCFETCDFFNFGGASCPGTDVCLPGGLCLPPANTGYEMVALEGACAGAVGGELCALNGDGYTGACNDFGSGMICHAFCTAAKLCTYAGATLTSCNDVFAPPLQGVVGACVQ